MSPPPPPVRALPGNATCMLYFRRMNLCGWTEAVGKLLEPPTQGPWIMPGTHMHDLFLTRRQLLQRGGMGFGVLGLAGVLESAGMLTPAAHAEVINPLA